ncbi:MAG: hypothetical protein H0W61_02490 [Bacteroidetes bacterium]|nr:hypothetical protein [Bacteroidota bacterium]
MKTIKIVAALSIIMSVTLGTSSCVVVKRDNGLHRGWYKNSNNPHNPASTNPGNGNNGGGHGRGKGK